MYKNRMLLPVSINLLKARSSNSYRCSQTNTQNLYTIIAPYFNCAPGWLYDTRTDYIYCVRRLHIVHSACVFSQSYILYYCHVRCSPDDAALAAAHYYNGFLLRCSWITWACAANSAFSLPTSEGSRGAFSQSTDK